MEWEEHVQKLLKRRYKSDDYQQIPAETHGDSGLEGYACDGSAYQCYAAQGFSNYQQLYEKQRNKITTDINKFLQNEQELLKILGDVQIKSWNLVVPCWMNKDLIKHAKVKEQLVRSAAPKHAAKNFRIFIKTEEDFAVEAQELANVNLSEFDPQVQAIPDQFLENWLAQSSNIELIENLNRKADLIGASRPPKFLSRFRARQAKNFIAGSVVLSRLERDLPETFKRVVQLKEQKENDLDTETLTNNEVPSAFFDHTLKTFNSQLSSTPGLSSRAVAVLANEAVADWLLRCPLDF